MINADEKFNDYKMSEFELIYAIWNVFDIDNSYVCLLSDRHEVNFVII